MGLSSSMSSARNHYTERGHTSHESDSESKSTQIINIEDESSKEDECHTSTRKFKKYEFSPDDMDSIFKTDLTSKSRLKENQARLEKELVDAKSENQRHIWTERGLRARLEEITQEKRDAIISQISAEEKLSQQSKILEKAIADLNERDEELKEAMENNASLLLEQMKFRKWNEQLDDDEISRTVSRLYQEIERWIRRHFQLPPDQCCLIYTDVSKRIFNKFLARVMIGIVDDIDGDQSLGYAVDKISKEVQKTCPSSIAQHWFPATSKGAFSMNHNLLSFKCERITRSIETEYGDYSQTSSSEKRTEGLKSLVWKFVEFKARLETQNDRYEFFEFIPGTAFNEQEMISYTGVSGSGIVVDYTLAHALFKMSANGDRTLIQRARVVTKQMSDLIDDS